MICKGIMLPNEELIILNDDCCTVKAGNFLFVYDEKIETVHRAFGPGEWLSVNMIDIPDEQ